MSDNTGKIKVGFIGNPNCGKTTLFNAYTGANLKVANWPGVTVEKKEGSYNYKGTEMTLIDLPGIYSRTSYSIEERVSRKCITEDDVDVIVDVLDASSLERNMYLTLQLLELGKPVVLALNMMDVVEDRGMELDLHRLPEMLGDIPVVPVSARKRSGLDVLMHAVVHHYEEMHVADVVHYNDELEKKIEQVQSVLAAKCPDVKNTRWTALKLMEDDEEICEKYRSYVKDVIDRDYSDDIIKTKYEYIEEIIDETLFNKDKKAAMTDKADRILTHPVWGIPIFFVIMALVFFLTFTVGDALKGVLELGIDWFSKTVYDGLNSVHVASWLVSLIVDGIITGVGGILSFLPNIAILFLALAFLEDSGYMSRVAYVMDGVMGKVGVSGKGFLPMILGFGCTVPAVMATRTLEHEKDRRRIITCTPFMSCSARLPIYILFSEMFFPKYAMFVSFSMYVIGILVAIGIAMLMNLFDKSKDGNSLLIELPEYKAPNARTIGIYVWEKVKDYLSKAGTTILIASVIIWFVLNVGPHGMTGDIEQSFGAMIGKWLVPVLKPAGLGMWQIAVALISGISAKEVVVSSMSVLFGIGNAPSAAGMTQCASILAGYGFGALNAYAFMVFCLLYTPCVATLATIRKETNSWAFTLRVMLLQLVFAWLMAVLVYQVGSLIF